MSPSPRAALFQDRNFRWLLAGGAMSMLGDQFTLIALPWLVLKLTGDPFALGLVIAMMSVPRAIFMLLGGALVDRYTPKRIMMLSKYASAVLLGALSALVLSGHALPMPLLYALALAIGFTQAFAIPAGTAIMPQVIDGARLQAANGIMMGLRQLTMLAGPVLAALLIALSGDGGGAIADGRGLGIAFAIDCASFVLSAWTLTRVKMLADTGARAAEPNGARALFRSVGAGLTMVWRDTALRTCFLYWSLIAVLVGGAMQVALPLLASRNLHGAGALGVLIGAHGVGTLLGMALSGLGQRLRLASFGTTILLVDGAAGLLLMPLGAITAPWHGAVLLLLVGILGGFMQIAVFTWIQRRVPPQMLGRAMSIFMFIFMGLAPLSAAAIGALLVHISLTQLFLGGGVLMVLIAALAYGLTPMRTITAAST